VPGCFLCAFLCFLPGFLAGLLCQAVLQDYYAGWSYRIIMQGGLAGLLCRAALQDYYAGHFGEVLFADLLQVFCSFSGGSFWFVAVFFARFFCGFSFLRDEEKLK